MVHKSFHWVEQLCPASSQSWQEESDERGAPFASTYVVKSQSTDSAVHRPRSQPLAAVPAVLEKASAPGTQPPRSSGTTSSENLEAPCQLRGRRPPDSGWPACPKGPPRWSIGFTLFITTREPSANYQLCKNFLRYLSCRRGY